MILDKTLYLLSNTDPDLTWLDIASIFYLEDVSKLRFDHYESCSSSEVKAK